MPKPHSLLPMHGQTNSGITEAENNAIISGELQHTKLNVFVDALFMHLMAKHPNLYQNHEFLNRDSYSQELNWNFSATSHDKGIVDGIGGMVM